MTTTLRKGAVQMTENSEAGFLPTCPFIGTPAVFLTIARVTAVARNR